MIRVRMKVLGRQGQKWLAKAHYGPVFLLQRVEDINQVRKETLFK